jgi:hypothetical protein
MAIGLWILIGLSLVAQYIETIRKIGAIDKILVCVILLAAGPCFLVVSFLSAVLEGIYPGGWE